MVCFSCLLLCLRVVLDRVLQKCSRQTAQDSPLQGGDMSLSVELFVGVGIDA
jgi:hypothetical protein